MPSEFDAGKVVRAPFRPTLSRPSVDRGNLFSDYDGTVCFQRSGVFSSQDDGIPVGNLLGPPIVGRIEGSAILLGMRQGLDRQFVGIERGAEGVSLVDGKYWVWETKRYYQKPYTILADRPKVCLVSANQFQLPVLSDSTGTSLVERITARYDEIEELGVQLILDQSANWHYVPFEMAVPMDLHASPFWGLQELQFTGEDVLSIHFWPEEFGPVGSTPGSGGTGGVTWITGGGQKGYQEVWGSYFHYRSALTGFPEGNGPLYYNEFQSPLVDGQLYTNSIPRYNRRLHKIHRPLFSGAPFPWATSVAFPGVPTFGPSPLPYGPGYQGALPAGAAFGRDYTYDFNQTGAASTSLDICDAIFEDLHAVFRDSDSDLDFTFG